MPSLGDALHPGKLFCFVCSEGQQRISARIPRRTKFGPRTFWLGRGSMPRCPGPPFSVLLRPCCIRLNALTGRTVAITLVTATRKWVFLYKARKGKGSCSLFLALRNVLIAGKVWNHCGTCISDAWSKNRKHREIFKDLVTRNELHTGAFLREERRLDSSTTMLDMQRKELEERHQQEMKMLRANMEKKCEEKVAVYEGKIQTLRSQVQALTAAQEALLRSYSSLGRSAASNANPHVMAATSPFLLTSQDRLRSSR